MYFFTGDMCSCFCFHGSSRRPTVLTVDMTGKGDYRTIQEAIDAIPAAANNSTSAAIVTINVNPGIYT
jgi:pectin methylesterase-like acyl-CoA thioesterase